MRKLKEYVKIEVFEVICPNCNSISVGINTLNYTICEHCEETIETYED